MTLANDITSEFNTSKKYAVAGERVALWKECGNVWIVEKEDGERFPMEIGEVLRHLAGSVQIKTSPPSLPKQKGKTTKAAVISSQQNLF